MDKLSKTTIWLNRILIIFVSVLFTIIGFRNMLHPAESAAAVGITLSSGKAFSVARVSMGAFPFAFAIFTFTSIFSNKELFRGILGVFILIVVTTVVRLVGLALDGTAPFIAPEIVITVLSGVGLYLESRRRKWSLKNNKKKDNCIHLNDLISRNMNDKTAIFLEYKSLLFSMAYNMLAEVDVAEDIVQDTYLKWIEMETAPIRHTKAYLVKMITNKCINYLTSARAKREEYVGIWLPEPLPAQGSEVADARIDSYYSLSIGFLLLLEKLTPYERGIFLLREVFAYDYFELSEIFDKTVDNCRQIFRRAKESLGKNVKRFPVDTQVHERILKNFLKAVTEGNMEDLIDMLKEDTVFYADGGGTVLQLNGQRLTAISKPLQGRENIGRFLTTIGKKVFQFMPEFSQQVMVINGIASNVSFSGNKPLSILSIELEGEKIASLFIQANPAKLKYFER